VPQHNDVPPSPKSKHLPMPAKKKKKRVVTGGQAAAALARGKKGGY
jgi:hypothetical protein